MVQCYRLMLHIAATLCSNFLHYLLPIGVTLYVCTHLNASRILSNFVIFMTHQQHSDTGYQFRISLMIFQTPKIIWRPVGIGALEVLHPHLDGSAIKTHPPSVHSKPLSIASNLFCILSNFLKFWCKVPPPKKCGVHCTIQKSMKISFLY